MQRFRIDINAQCVDKPAVGAFGQQVEQLPAGAAGQVHDTQAADTVQALAAKPVKEIAQQPAPVTDRLGRDLFEQPTVDQAPKLAVPFRRHAVYMLDHLEIARKPFGFVIGSFGETAAHEIGKKLLENVPPHQWNILGGHSAAILAHLGIESVQGGLAIGKHVRRDRFVLVLLQAIGNIEKRRLEIFDLTIDPLP